MIRPVMVFAWNSELMMAFSVAWMATMSSGDMSSLLEAVSGSGRVEAWKRSWRAEHNETNEAPL